MSFDPVVPEIPAGPRPGVGWTGSAAGPNRLARNTALSLVAILALGSTRLLYNVIVGHLRSKSVFGHVNTEISVGMFAALLIGAGTAAAAAKFVPAALGRHDSPGAQATLRTLARWCTVGTLATTAAVAAVMPFALPRSSATDVTWTACLLAGYSAYSFVKGGLYGYNEVRHYTILELGSDALTLAAAIGVVLGGLDAALLAPFVAGYGTFALLGWARLSRVAGRRAVPALSSVDPAEMRAFVAAASLGTLASSGFLQLSMVFAQRYGTPVQAGDYASALTLVLPAYFVPRALSLALFPAMANAFGRGDEIAIRRQLETTTRLLLLGMLPFFGAAIQLAKPLLVLFFGTRFASADLVLELLLVATYVSIVSIAAVNSLVATERRAVRIPAGASVVGCLLGIGLWIALGPPFATTGIAVGYLLGSIVQSGVPFATAMRRYRVRCTDLLVRAGVLVITTGLLRIALPTIARTIGSALLAAGLASLLLVGLTFVVCPREARAVGALIRGFMPGRRKR